MKITPIKTEIVQAFSSDIKHILSNSLKNVRENSIIVITSKIISLTEGNVIPIDGANRDRIIEEEADLYLNKSENQYGVYLTIKNNNFIPNAGVDESNTNGYYVKWPENPQVSANLLCRFIRENHKINNVGVLISDSTTTPLKWGVIGICVAYSGFEGVTSRISDSDLFGRKLKMTKINIADALAAAAVLCMGESNEQTPIAVIEDVPFVNFRSDAPNESELKSNKIDISDDIYGQLLQLAPWKHK